MSDRVADAFAALDRMEAPISWDDVVALENDVDVPDVSDLATAAEARSSRRRVTAVAAVAAALVVAVVIIVVRADGESDPTVVTVPSTLPTTTSSTPTTNAATSSFRVFPVTAWAGDRYLVWSGEDGSTQIPRADGWSYDPATGETTDIPTAPIAARTEAVGIWTGDELIVCCGGRAEVGAEYGSVDAAAYRPDTGTWRRLANPPDDADRGFGAAVWTGDEMIVVFGRTYTDSETLLALSYDPSTDRWRKIADPPATLARIPQAVWTGEEVIVWSGDRGDRYDPATDTWTALPDLPAALAMSDGSIAWTGDEIIVYGAFTPDESHVSIASWRPGDQDWHGLANPGLPPVNVYEGTRGSQSLAWDSAQEMLVVWPVNGGESSSPLLAYDPSTGAWHRLGNKQLGYHPQLEAVNGLVLQPDRDKPVVISFSRIVTGPGSG